MEIVLILDSSILAKEQQSKEAVKAGLEQIYTMKKQSSLVLSMANLAPTIRQKKTQLSC